MPRFERRVDKHGFPIPAQIDDLPGRDAKRDVEQYGNVNFDSSGKREFSASGQRWKRRIIWLGIISVAVGLLFSSFAQPLWEMYADMRTQMGMRSFYDHNFAAAREHFDAALSADSTQLAARVYRGKALYALQELDAAHADLTIGIDSKNEDARFLALDTRALINYRQQRTKEAMRDADEAVNLKRNDLSARNGRAYLCALLGQDLKKGLDDINFALNRDPENGAFLDTRGYLLYKQGDYDAALRDLDKAIKSLDTEFLSYQDEQKRSNPGRRKNMTHEQFEGNYKQLRESLGVLYYHRGEIYEALKRPEEAASEKALGVEYGYNPAEGVF
jgi:Tfp pilus assembly protein PilF